MDSTLRCNSLKCRVQLNGHAVVTTCTHIFCLTCSNNFGLIKAESANRRCPACEARLPDVDSVVVTHLNPSEEYKTSLLSGLAPNVILECAGRGLYFYSYQASQEILYQEYSCKTLTARFNDLSAQMDRVILDANTEVTRLRDKTSVLQQDKDALQIKHAELSSLYSGQFKAYARMQKQNDDLQRHLQQMGSETVSTGIRRYQHSPPLHERFIDRAPKPQQATIHESKVIGSVGKRRSSPTHYRSWPTDCARNSIRTPSQYRISLPMSTVHNSPDNGSRDRVPQVNRVQGPISPDFIYGTCRMRRFEVKTASYEVAVIFVGALSISLEYLIRVSISIDKGPKLALTKLAHFLLQSSTC